MPVTSNISKSGSAGPRLQGNQAGTARPRGRLFGSARSIQQLPTILRRSSGVVTPPPESGAGINRQRPISTIRVVTGCLLGAAVGVAIGGPIGIGVGAVVGTTYVLVGPKAMWQVVQRSGRAIATHIQDYRAKSKTPATV